MSILKLVRYSSVIFNAKDAKAFVKERKEDFSSAIFAANFADFAFKCLFPLLHVEF